MSANTEVATTIPKVQAKILLVDDERDNLEALKRLLRKEFNVVTALSGEEALEILKKDTAFEVIVSDQRMPGLQGSELLEKVRSIAPLATRILLTGFSDLEAVIEAVNRGQIWKYISKPWEPEEFVYSMKQAAERSHLRSSLDESNRELEKLVLELRARDWARERLLLLLLHEFRTFPQMIHSIEELVTAKEKPEIISEFFKRVQDRFEVLALDLSNLLDEEKKVAMLPKEDFLLSDLLKDIGGSWKIQIVSGLDQEKKIFSNRQKLGETLKFIYQLMCENSESQPVTAKLDTQADSSSHVFFAFEVEAPKANFPKSLQNLSLDAPLAWKLLFEPFVGHEKFEHHSHGLRTESSKQIRFLHALGVKHELEVVESGKKVIFLMSFTAKLNR